MQGRTIDVSKLFTSSVKFKKAVGQGDCIIGIGGFRAVSTIVESDVIGW